MAALGSGQRHGTVPPVVAARWALGAFVVLNVVIIEALFLTGGSGKNGTLTVAKFFGLHAALLMLLQLLLVARLPWLDRRLGMDRLTVWHRWTGFTLLWTVLTHAVLVVLGYARLDDASMARTFAALAGVPASLLGMLAAAGVVLVATVSIRPLRRRLRYETWHALHLLLYLVLGLAFVHQLLETTTFTSSVFAEAYWWTMWLSAFGALLAGRIVLPVWRNRYHRFRVEAVVPESDDVVSVHVTGHRLDRLPARAGQFCVWRFPGHNHWWPANPFSLSAAPDGRTLRLTAKAVGTTSAGLRHLPVGSRVYLEGPYGAFTSLHRTRPGALLIAGGVGITPVRALLEEDPDGDVVVLYRVRSEADAVLADEIRNLVAVPGRRLHLLTGRTRQDRPPFAPENLRALVPDITERDVYVCGPPAMTSAVLHGLRALHVPGRQIHAERFALA
ncbi:ferredoxin reductase family protein [Streptomyces sp. SID7958]|uniref:Ferredoxin reductase family protein n=2 Tax=unclassified Streptomyces TaxID=2593676 RepID=A0A6G3QTF3_9ACTN|nr:MULTISPECIES: ferredoxin reductase family protein [unclassified Streptomyces]NEA86783.1 ferredoxin reductase family protein [Streptomyces sp. SID14436]NEC78540.1 ferredoxin reductase family protein [Streptomyces sp. SID7958]